MTHSIDKVITIKRFLSLPETHLAKAELESCGIPAFIQDQHIVSMNFWYSQTTGWVKLQVFESDYELAQKILNDDPVIVDDQKIEGDQCLKCNSREINYHKDKNWKKRGLLSFLSLFLLGFPWIFRSNHYRCQSCGLMWQY